MFFLKSELILSMEKYFVYFVRPSKFYLIREYMWHHMKIIMFYMWVWFPISSLPQLVLLNTLTVKRLGNS